MTDFRAKRGPGIPVKVIQPVPQAKVTPLSQQERRRGVRLNSQVPVALEWSNGGKPVREEAQTRVVGPYGCLVVFPQGLEVQQQISVTNLVSKQSNLAVVVWRGVERPEGWELGIELINPQMGFWGLDL